MEDYIQYGKEVLTTIDRLERDQKIRGNIIPEQFYGSILDGKGKCDILAVLILADIFYWYRPVAKKLDDGKVELRPKYAGELLQKSATEFEQKFNVSKDKVRKSLKSLQDNDWISQEIRNGVRMGNKIWNNVRYIKINIEKIDALLREEISAENPAKFSVIIDPNVDVKNDQHLAEDVYENSYMDGEKQNELSHTHMGKEATKVAEIAQEVVENENGISLTNTKTTTKTSTEDLSKTTVPHTTQKEPDKNIGEVVEVPFFGEREGNYHDPSQEQTSKQDYELSELNSLAKTFFVDLPMDRVEPTIIQIASIKNLNIEAKKLMLTFCILSNSFLINPSEMEEKWKNVVFQWDREKIKPIDIARAISKAKLGKKDENTTWAMVLRKPSSYDRRVYQEMNDRVNGQLQDEENYSAKELIRIVNQKPREKRDVRDAFFTL